MKVKELVEKLKECGEDWEVLTESMHGSYHFNIGKLSVDKMGDKNVVFLHEGKQLWMKRKKGDDKVNQLKNASDKEKKLNLILLSKLMDWCYIDKLTGQFYCKKCKCAVSIDWNNHLAYCVTGGEFCVCISEKDLE